MFRRQRQRAEFLVVLPRAAGLLLGGGHVIPAHHHVRLRIDVQVVMIPGREADGFEAHLEHVVLLPLDLLASAGLQLHAAVEQLERHEQPIGVVGPALHGGLGVAVVVLVGELHRDGLGVPGDGIGAGAQVPVVLGGHLGLAVLVDDVEGESDARHLSPALPAAGVEDLPGQLHRGVVAGGGHQRDAQTSEHDSRFHRLLLP